MPLLDFMNKKFIKKEIFLDQLNWESFLFLFLKRGVKKVLVLDSIKPQNLFFKFLLNLKGLSIKEKSFFVGHLFNIKKKSIYLLAGEIVDKLAFKISEESINKSLKLNHLNTQYGNNTIRLFIAKTYKPKLFYWIIRGLTSKNLASSQINSVELFIKDPIIFEKESLDGLIKGLTYNFYSFKIKQLVVIKSYIFYFFKSLMKSFIDLFSKRNLIEYDANLSSVLSLQEESIRLDQSLRNQYSWYEIKKNNQKFNSFVLINNFYPNPTKIDIDDLNATKNYVLSQNFLNDAKKNYKNHRVRKLIKKEIRDILKILLKTKNLSQKYLLFQVFHLLKTSDSLASLCLLLNTKVFLIKECQYITSDAIQLVSSFIDVETICIQYSNMTRPNPMTMTTSDKFLIFSDNYKKVFSTKKIYPKKFIETGYPLNGIQNKLIHRVNKIKKDLEKKNVRFVIGYFDESIADTGDKWGLVHREDHLKDIRALARAVIADSSLSVLIKNQFVSNDLNKIFPEDLLIKKAKETDRFISISEGSHRNDVYPMQIALISDFCIGYKFGGTAAIESAITGTRTVLVDRYNFDTAHDNIYSKANIIYKDFNSLIQDIIGYRAKQARVKDIGDWSSIINYFDPFLKNDNNSVLRNYQIIQSAIN